MKKAMKKLMAALLAVAMVCAMAIPAFAAGGAGATTGEGKITIDNAVIGHTYKIYRILNLQYNDTAKSFRYEKNDKWGAFVEEQTAYLAVDSKTGVVTWANSDNADNGTAIKALAVAAGQHVTDTPSLAADDSKVAASNTVIFDNLPLGWYLVVSDLTTDAICSIDTTAKQVTIREKNGVPTVTKEVEYASGSWGEGNDGNVGDTVNFQTTIYVTDGNPTNYVLHDKMSNGLAFQTGTISVKKNGDPFTDYTIETPIDDCTFEIKFKEGSLHTNDKVVVTYSATINSNAVVGTAGNENETWLKYGNNGETTHGRTKTYTWKFNILKFFTDSNDEKQYLADVEFVLYRKNNTTDPAEYAKFDSNNKLTGWTKNESEAGKLRTNATSNVCVEGLDEGTYFLKETATPVGFNSLTSDVEVQITSSCNTLTNATYTVQYKMVNDEDFADTDDKEKVVPIENKRGTVLPGTGGIGTTIFYVVGGGLMVAAAILLITKKRMENH
jgi:fimbrial isopeptide formation D2 family protein/LPXTG-motif cell wall-anchored protein